ncbi:hypothetical protein [Streptomyces sp. 3N207]|uniref:hypothetical protein n=1 Tax=Streptomyces sp. 3N207 TaxID=3457417 RepID=UPI003FD5D116
MSARQMAVKKKYGLWVTRAEKDAMTRMLDSCPGERLQGGGKSDGGADPVLGEVGTCTRRRYVYTT